MNLRNLAGEADVIFDGQTIARVRCRLRVSVGRGSDVTAMGDSTRSRVPGTPSITGQAVLLSGTMPPTGGRFVLKFGDGTTYSLASEHVTEDRYRVF